MTGTALEKLLHTISISEAAARQALDSAMPEEITKTGPTPVLVAAGLSPSLFDRIGTLQQTHNTPEADLNWARFYYELREWDELQALAESARSTESHSAQHLLTSCLIDVRLAWSLIRRGDHKKATVLCEHISERNALLPSDLELLGELAHVRSALQFRFYGNPIAALGAIDLSVAALRQKGGKAALVRALIFRALLQKAGGNLSSSKDSIIEGLDVASLTGNRRLFAYALSQKAVVSYRLGDLQLAKSEIQIVQTIERPSHRSETAILACLLRLRLALIENRVSIGRRCALILENLRSSTDYRRNALIEEYLGILDHVRGLYSNSLDRYQAATEFLQSCGLTSYELPELHLRRAEALIALHRYSEARSACDTALDMLGRPGESLESGHIYRQRGLANHAMARPTDAHDDFERAEVELRRVGDRYELARLLLDRAELYPRETEAALKDAEEAVTLAEQVGVRHLLDRARDICDLAQLRFNEERRSRRVAEAFAQDRPDIIARSQSMKFVLGRAVEYGRATQPILITGETGAGKEIVAQTVHSNSSRSKRDLISLNCAAVPESLIERELFGHVRGAFTGADRDRDGIVDAAHKGTLFLDEIGELPMAMQAKLLRLLQNGGYRPVGATKEKHADIRIIAATHRNLFTMTRNGQFREDLYYRIAGLRIAVPPLRERIEDTVALANLFMEEQSQEHGWNIWMDRDAWRLVKSFHWPGNVRQLQSVIRAACLIAGESSVIKVEHLRELLADEFDYFEAERARTSLDYHENIQATERRLIRAALEQANYCRKTAAQLLGIGRNTIYEKIKKLGMEPELPERTEEG